MKIKIRAYEEPGHRQIDQEVILTRLEEQIDIIFHVDDQRYLDDARSIRIEINKQILD